MKITNRALIDRFTDFFRDLTPEDNIALIHDGDPDGICSAAIVARVLTKLKLKPTLVLSHGGAKLFTDEEIRLLKKINITKVITTDISFDEEPSRVKQVERFAYLLIIDHHALFHDINSKKTILFKPQLFLEGSNPAKYCSSKLVYDYGNKVADVSDADWIAAVGLISDIGADLFSTFVRNVFKRYRLKPPRISLKNYQQLFETKLGKVSIAINNALVYNPKNAKLAYRIVRDARNYNDVLNSPLKKYHDAIQNEIDTYEKNFMKRATIYPELELALYEIPSKYNVKSALCTILALKYTHLTIILYTRTNGIVRVSTRRNDYRVDLSGVLSAITKHVPGMQGGGHIPSAGAVVPTSHFELFKKLLLEKLPLYRRENIKA